MHGRAGPRGPDLAESLKTTEIEEPINVQHLCSLEGLPQASKKPYQRDRCVCRIVVTFTQARCGDSVSKLNVIGGFVFTRFRYPAVPQLLTCDADRDVECLIDVHTSFIQAS